MGEFGGAATIVHNGGYFTTPYLSVYNGNSLALAASDSITYIAAISGGSHLTTASSYNFSTALNLTVDTGSTLTLGSSTSVGGTLDLEDGSTLDMGGHPLSANGIDIGWIERQQPVNVLNRGPITVTYLQVAVQPFSLIPADAVTELNVANSGSVTTAAIGNVTSSVNLSTSSTLTLGSSMSISSRAGRGGQIDAQYGGQRHLRERSQLGLDRLAAGQCNQSRPNHRRVSSGRQHAV